jgi:exosome complex component RRP42
LFFCDSNVRSDGRTRDTYRQFTLKTNTIPHTNGSSHIQLNGVDITVAINLEIIDTDLQYPNDGKITCSVQW